VVERVRVVYSELHGLHADPSGFHSEGPWRVESIVSELKSEDFEGLVEFTSPPGPDYSAVLLAHSAGYVEWIRGECARGFHYVDPDTYVNEYTCDLAASFAAASRVAALRALSEGGVWIILARPGGHHAGREGRAMGAPTLGFCVFDYTSIAALTAIEEGAVVLALDFDAHHANGSQEILWSEPRAVHVDIHEWGIYPGTGWITDIGGPGAEGTKINIPLSRGAGDPEYAWTLRSVVERAVSAVKPELLVVFAGFDAHREDPLTGLEATEATYGLYGDYLGRLVRSETVRGAVVILGGGYSRGLVSGFKSFTKSLLGLERPARVEPEAPGRVVEERVPTILRKLEEAITRTKRGV
jgi:acetoin utilization deacetylase AcuC-like enzyme